MDTLLDIRAWAESVITYWKSQRIELNDDASEKEIAAAEQALGIQFPGDFKVLYEIANGFKNYDWNEFMISIWPIERMLEEHSYMRYPGFVGFADFLINSIAFGFLKNKPGIYKFYDLEDARMPIQIAQSFQEAIDLIISNSDLLY